jgi:hypothetical protein
VNTELQKRALAARDAHLALLDLKKVVDEAVVTTHAAELEAVHLAISPRSSGEVSTTLRIVVERLASAHFEGVLMKARESLQTAIFFR